MEYVIFRLLPQCGVLCAADKLAEVRSREELEVWAKSFKERNPNVQFIACMK